MQPASMRTRSAGSARSRLGHLTQLHPVHHVPAMAPKPPLSPRLLPALLSPVKAARSCVPCRRAWKEGGGKRRLRAALVMCPRLQTEVRGEVGEGAMNQVVPVLWGGMFGRVTPTRTS